MLCIYMSYIMCLCACTQICMRVLLNTCTCMQLFAIICISLFQHCQKYFKKQLSCPNVDLSFVGKTGVITADVIDDPDWVVDFNENYCKVRIEFYQYVYTYSYHHDHIFSGGESYSGKLQW